MAPPDPPEEPQAPPPVPPQDIPRQPFFCEENVWQLLRSGRLPSPAAAVFLTNPARTVAMWGQRAARTDPIVWDYHVVAAAAGWILDGDDRDGRPRRPTEWLEHAFRAGVAVAYRPWFRVVPAATFLDVFSSDRSHMLDGDGRPQRPFPVWPAPFQPSLGMNLLRFLDLADPIAGHVTAADGLATAIAQLR